MKNINIGFESLKEKSIKEINQIEDNIKEDLVKFECDKCGCYFWIGDRNGFNCPNCEYHEQERIKEKGLSNNKRVRNNTQLNKPYAEGLIRGLK